MYREKNITYYDTSIATKNLGDFIIMDSASEQIYKIFSDSFLIKLPAHDYTSLHGKNMLRKSSLTIFCGTNALTSHILKYRQWKFDPIDFFMQKNLVLLGVGWWQYQSKPDLVTKLFYNKILSKKILHSVRDSHTANSLKSIGINNVINTGCPTLWNINEEHCSSIPKTKGTRVIVTFTDYRPDLEVDICVLKLLMLKYSEVIIWPQGINDISYINILTKDLSVKPKIAGTNVAALNFELLKPGTDYIGTRLHAGIRALQFKKRTLILSVDNRAEEKRKDFNIPVVARGDLDSIKNWIESSFETDIHVPHENISIWKSQFE